MTILEELKEFFRNILYVIYFFLGLTIFFFSFGLKKIVIFGGNYLLPLLTHQSFSVAIFNKVERDLLPIGVHLIVTNPLSAFISQIQLSLFLAFIISFPFFVYKIIRYLSPALFKHEKIAIMKCLAPSIALFFIGCAFSYHFLIPGIFKILYSYVNTINATSFFSVNEFISSVLGIMIATGMMFLLPLFMMLLSFIGLVDSAFWKSKWRHALLFFLIFTAIIIPDPTGITMMILILPLMGLYFAGCILTSRFNKSKIYGG